MSVKRRDSKNRVLRNGESQKPDGRYVYKYYDILHKPHYLYSWKLEPTDKLPSGKKDDLSLREKIRQLQKDMIDGIDVQGSEMTVLELVKRYIATKTGVKPSTEAGYKTIVNILEKEVFAHLPIKKIRYSDAMYILFHTGLRVSEFVGLTISDLDMKNKTIRIDHQLQRKGDGMKYITSTKTNAGTRTLPMEDDVHACFQRILANRHPPAKEPSIDGYSGFLFFDKDEHPMVAMHWEHYFKHAWRKYNSIYKEELPPITPHVCRHTYCTIKAKSGMNPKTLQYLMGHSEVSITMDTYTHLGLQDAWDELSRLQLEFSKKELGLKLVKSA